MLQENHSNAMMPAEVRERLDRRVISNARTTKPAGKRIVAGIVAGLVLTAGTVAGFQLTGEDAPTGKGDILSMNQVMSQAEYDTTYPDGVYSFDGFIYDDALNLQLRFQSNEELEAFTKDLQPLQSKEMEVQLKSKFSGEHIVYGNSKISTAAFTELHRDNKATWVKCYLPQEILNGSDIRAYDSEEELKSDVKPC